MKQLDKLKRFKLLTLTPQFQQSVNETRTANGQKELTGLLNERIVFSFLAYRSRTKAGATINQLVRETRLHKSTVNKTLSHLQSFVYQHDGEWHCNEPPTGFLATFDNSKGTHWSDRCKYLTYYVPSPGAKIGKRRFGVKHAVVVSVIASFTKKANPHPRLSISLASKVTGINRKTVSAIFDDLLSAELIKFQRSGVLFNLMDAHLDLFQRQEKREIDSSAPKSASNAKGKYEFKDDPFDSWRKLCEPHFAQSHAEQAISLARKLGYDSSMFESELRAAKLTNDENIKAGKVPYPNFGKFFSNRLQRRLEERVRMEQEAEAEQRRQAYRNSDEFKAKQKEEEKAARADPLHPMHTINTESITDRVKLAEDARSNWQAADDIRRRVHLHCKHYWMGKSLTTQQSVDYTSMLLHELIGQALAKLNHHYDAETFASREELENAIDAVTSTVKDLKPVFQPRTADSPRT